MPTTPNKGDICIDTSVIIPLTVNSDETQITKLIIEFTDVERSPYICIICERYNVPPTMPTTLIRFWHKRALHPLESTQVRLR